MAQYRALYRKWRPQTFDDVYGQPHVTRTLKTELATGRVSHAYLFTGPRGTGKTSVAKILAKVVNCESLNNVTPCNKCVSCTQINDRQNTDIIEIKKMALGGIPQRKTGMMFFAVGSAYAIFL